MLDFLGIGAQKSGTTWLYFNLVRHAQIFLTPDKELHFWDRHRDRGLDWYRAQFAAVPADRKGGEITPAYAILPSEVIAEIAREFPSVRLLFLMRNPVERAWSSALMALGRAEMSLEEASDAWFIDHFHSAGSFQRGDYETCLRNWLASYAPDQFLILLFDDIVADPRAALRRCAAHIGIAAAGFDAVPDEDMRRAVYAGPGHPIRPSLRRHLARLYEPRIRALERFLGRDLSRWHAANQDQDAPPGVLERLGMRRGA